MTGSLPWADLLLPRSRLENLEILDSGGEGTIYRAPGQSDRFERPVVYKEYRPDSIRTLDEATLYRFATFVRSLDIRTADWLYQRAAWPSWIVVGPGSGEEPDGPLGVVMPLAPERFMIKLRRATGGPRMAPAKFELLLNGEAFLGRIGLAVSGRQRLGLLQAVAETMAFFHGHSITVGDFSCKNLLFALHPQPSCMFIDCDSMWWGNTHALAPGETPEWELPPGEALGSSASDVYKFGLLVLRIHTGAQHHRNPGRMPADADPEIRALLERSINDDSSNRPLITEWLAPLSRAAEALPVDPLRQRDAAAPMGRNVPILAPVPFPRPPARTPPARVPPARLGHGPRRVAASPRRSRLAASTAQGPILGDGWFGRYATRCLRWMLVRSPASPSPLKLAAVVVGFWSACAVVLLLALGAGLQLGHMSGSTQVLLFVVFVLLAAAAFGLATTQPR